MINHIKSTLKKKWLLFVKISTNKQIKIISALFAMVFIAWILVFINEEKDKLLEINFYDVGQGDAIFIEMPNKKQVLVDGGPDLTILEKLGNKMPFWDRYIDLIVLTHPEHDHINGLIEVIKRYKIGGILTTGVVRNTAEYKEWINIIKEKRIPIIIAQSGKAINLGDNIELFIIYPFENLSGKEVKNVNNSSIVTQLIYKDFELLLTGDIEKEIEKKLIKNPPVRGLESEVLKIAHHGSKSSTINEFILAVNPLVAVIQAGRNNPYGHPHEVVLNKLSNIPTLVTGRDGDIEILTNGTDFKINIKNKR